MTKPLRLSPSAINTFYRCPRLFYYNYILKQRTPPNIHLYKGNFVHKALEDLFDLTTYVDVQAFMDERMKKWKPSKAIVDHTEDIEYHKKDAANILEQFANRFNRKIEMVISEGKAKGKTHAWNLLKPKLREHKIFDEKLNLVGIIDSIEQNFDNQVYVIDYKTSKLYRHTLPEDYIRQVTIYAYLYYVEFGKLPDFVGVDYLRYSEVYLVPVVKEMLSNVKNYVDEVRKGSVSKNKEDYAQCNNDWCDCHYLEKKNGGSK